MQARTRYATLARLAARTTLATLILGTVAAGEAAAATNLSSWGDNSGGELGNGTLSQSDVPVAVRGVGAVKTISAGYRFNLALLSSGTVDAWGENQFGELGNGTATDSAVVVPVRGLSGVTAVSAGGGHSLALLSNGTVMAWGYNAFGQLGDGTTTTRFSPVAVKGLSGVKAIAAGELHSLALLANGNVMAWGDNRDGQLGNGTVINSSVPVAVHGLAGVKAVSAGGLFSEALLSNTSVRAWGQGDNGELGNGGTTFQDVPVAVKGLTGVSAISTGDDHSLALLKSGTAMAWGDNSFGQLGDPGAGTSSNLPVPIPGLDHVSALAAGGLSSLALLSSGAVESWGDNALGQLGNGTTNDTGAPAAVPGLSRVSAISNGANHALVLTSSAATPRVQPAMAFARLAGPLTPWHVVSTPNPGAPPPPGGFDASFSAVSAASATDAWAVGNTQNGLNQIAFAEHWDGVAWRAATVPQPAGRQATFSSVLDVAPGNAWAVGRSVGNSPTDNQQRTLIEHWNGQAWSIVSSPNPQTGVGGNDQLGAIAGVSGNDIWAAGEDFQNQQGAQIFLLFEHFNGKTWSAVPSPPSTGFDFAFGLTAIASNDAWAVGTNGFNQTLAAHWNGARWSVVPTPSLQDGTAPQNQLTGVSAVASNDVWASGYEDNVNQTNFRKPYVLRWNGTSWKLILAPNAGTEGSLLRGIAAVSANDVWAVGQTQENDGSILSLTEKFNGTIWAIVPSPSPGGVGPIISNTLAAVASAGHGTVWALGSQEKLGFCCSQTLGLETSTG